jgi:hypothetical protein
MNINCSISRSSVIWSKSIALTELNCLNLTSTLVVRSRFRLLLNS